MHLPLPCFFARCVGPFSLCRCFWHFLSVFDLLTAFATWCPFFRSEAHVSELSFSDQGMAQLFSCRVKVFVQLSVLRTIFLRVSIHFPRQGPAVFVPCEGQRVVTCRAQAWLESPCHGRLNMVREPDAHNHGVHNDTLGAVMDIGFGSLVYSATEALTVHFCAME